MPKRLKLNNHTPKSPFFEALKELHAFQFLVWIAKIDNPGITLKELGVKYGISEQTAFKYVHAIDDKIKPYVLEQAENGLKRLIPLWLIKIQERLQEGSDWVISDFGKWIGLKERLELSTPADPSQTQEAFMQTLRRTTGLDFGLKEGEVSLPDRGQLGLMRIAKEIEAESMPEPKKEDNIPLDEDKRQE